MATFTMQSSTYISCKVDFWEERISPQTSRIHADAYYRRTNNWSGITYSNPMNAWLTIHGETRQIYGGYYQLYAADGWKHVGGWYKDISHGDAINVGVSYSCDSYGGYFNCSGSGSINCAAFYSAPTGVSGTMLTQDAPQRGRAYSRVNVGGWGNNSSQSWWVISRTGNRNPVSEWAASSSSNTMYWGGLPSNQIVTWYAEAYNNHGYATFAGPYKLSALSVPSASVVGGTSTPSATFSSTVNYRGGTSGSTTEDKSELRSWRLYYKRSDQSWSATESPQQIKTGTSLDKSVTFNAIPRTAFDAGYNYHVSITPVNSYGAWGDTSNLSGGVRILRCPQNVRASNINVEVPEEALFTMTAGQAGGFAGESESSGYTNGSMWGYQIEYSKNSDMSNSQTSALTKGNQINLTGLELNTTYYYRIRGYNTYGLSNLSAIGSFKSREEFDPQGVTITDFSSTGTFRYKNLSYTLGTEILYAGGLSIDSESLASVKLQAKPWEGFYDQEGNWVDPYWGTIAEDTSGNKSTTFNYTMSDVLSSFGYAYSRPNPRINGSTSQQTYNGFQLLTKQGMATPTSDTAFWNINTSNLTYQPLEDGWAQVTQKGTGFGDMDIKWDAIHNLSPQTEYTIIIELKDIEGDTSAMTNWTTLDVSQPGVASDPWMGGTVQLVNGLFWRSNTNVCAQLLDGSTSKTLVFTATTKSAATTYGLRMFNRDSVPIGTTYKIRTTVLLGNHSADWQNYCGASYEPYVGGMPSPNPDYPQEIQNMTIGNLELCQIGDYQDYAYYSEGKWYKHAEVQKIALNGSEDWYQVVENPNASDYYYITSQDFNSLSAIGSYLAELSDTFQNYGTWFLWNTAVDQEVFSFTLSGEQRMRLMIKKTRLASATPTAVKNWFSSHPTTIYFSLATATDTEITDTETLDELNKWLEEGWLTYFSGIDFRIVYTNTRGRELIISGQMTPPSNVRASGYKRYNNTPLQFITNASATDAGKYYFTTDQSITSTLTPPPMAWLFAANVNAPSTVGTLYSDQLSVTGLLSKISTGRPGDSIDYETTYNGVVAMTSDFGLQTRSQEFQLTTGPRTEWFLVDEFRESGVPLKNFLRLATTSTVSRTPIETYYVRANALGALPRYTDLRNMRLEFWTKPLYFREENVGLAIFDGPSGDNGLWIIGYLQDPADLNFKFGIWYMPQGSSAWELRTCFFNGETWQMQHYDFPDEDGWVLSNNFTTRAAEGGSDTANGLRSSPLATTRVYPVPLGEE